MVDHEDNMRKAKILKHFEGLRKADYWPGWVFLPHGTDKDPKSILSKKLWGVVMYDRQLVWNERDNQAELKRVPEKENPPC